MIARGPRTGRGALIGRSAAAAGLVALALGAALPQSWAAAQPASPERRAVKGPKPSAARAQPPAGTVSDYAARDEVRTFIRTMVDRHGFAEEQLLRVFAKVRHSDAALKLIAPASPAFKRSWIAYRDRFVEPVRIREGLRFWREHAEPVRRAAEQFGVPEEIVVSIIGVETIYGRNTGDFRVVDALTTLAFDYPRRAPFFTEELEQFLLLSREQRIDPLRTKGSFAGAIGLPQFMPGSIRRYAVDFDGDGRIDLLASPVDAIGSVARFLSEHGWQTGAATHFAVTVEDEARARPALEAGIPPALSPLELTEMGVTSPNAIPPDTRLSLIDLPNGDDSTHYVLGANNFWVITRYNRSYFYAMAVIDLAAALKFQRPPAATAAAGGS